MTARRPLAEALRDPDPEVRLRAAVDAADADEPGLAAALIDVALRDDVEVRVAFGLNDDTRHIGEEAAHSLGRQLDRRPDEVEPMLRAAVADPAGDDDGVARLLRHLGARGEALRRDLADSPDGRHRLRALKALSVRTVETTRHFMADPAPTVRAAAVQGAQAGIDARELLPLLADDDPEVRYWAAVKLSGRGVGREPFLAASRAETDPLALAGLLSGLRHHLDDPDVRSGVVGLLADPRVESEATNVLYSVDHPGVAAAFASRILVRDDLSAVLRHRHLLKHVPPLRDLLERLLRHTEQTGRIFLLTRALAEPDGSLETAADLTEEQRARLLHEVTGWAAAALDAMAADDTTDLHRLLADATAPRPVGLGGVGRERVDPGRAVGVAADRAGSGGVAVAADCLRAAVSGDLRAAMDAGVRAAVAGIADPATAGWAAELTRLAHQVTAVQIRHGLAPLPPGPLQHLRLDGEDSRTTKLVVRGDDGPAVALAAGEPAVFAGRPEYAVLRVPCPECGVIHRVAGVLTWQYRDDDRYAESEDGFAGTLDGPCPVCGATVSVEVRVSLTRSRADDSAELTWDR